MQKTKILLEACSSFLLYCKINTFFPPNQSQDHLQNRCFLIWHRQEASYLTQPSVPQPRCSSQLIVGVSIETSYLNYKSLKFSLCYENCFWDIFCLTLFSKMSCKPSFLISWFLLSENVYLPCCSFLYPLEILKKWQHIMDQKSSFL